MKVESLMITENDVIDSVLKELVEMGFEIVNKCNTYQKGIDIHAIRGEEEIMIEAKGGTTSKDTSRKGKPFNSGQVKDHIAVAVLKVMQLKQEYKEATVGIALPDDRKHRKLIDSIRQSLEALEIEIIWSDGKEVIIESINQ